LIGRRGQEFRGKIMRKALGKNPLDALVSKTGEDASTVNKSPSKKIPLKSIRPNRLQPRKNFDPERLSELSQSIKEHGLAQPLLVSYDAISNTYELIAGERRLRACQLAGLETVDVVIRTPKSDQDRLVVALVENLQRDNLNAIEAAAAYKKLMDDFSVTQGEVSKLVGKSKSAISNTLRLLDLPDQIQKSVQFEHISEGHARALLMVKDPEEQSKLFKKAIDQHLSVRQVEQLAQAIAKGAHIETKEGQDEKESGKIKSADVSEMEKQLEKSLGTRVEIRTKRDNKSGRVVIHFYSLSEFDNILKVLKI